MSEEIRKIGILEDMSIPSVDESHVNEYILEAGDVKLSSMDQDTTKLIILVDEYEKCLREMQNGFANGFLRLSRANYSDRSSIKRYSIASVDMRNSRASKLVNITDKFRLIDELDKNKKDNSSTSSDKPEIEKHCKTLLPESSTPSSLKHRKKSRSPNTDVIVDKTIDLEEEEAPIRNPLTIFGGLPHFQVHQSQSSFNSALDAAVSIINLRSEIVTLISSLEDLNN